MDSTRQFRRSGFAVVLLLAGIATIASSFGISAPLQVVVLNAEEESDTSVQPTSPEYFARSRGVGLAPSTATSEAERHQAALRAAHIVARRNLVAYAQGADIEAIAVVEDSTLERDEIREIVLGRLAGAETISESYNSGAGEAEVVLGIRRSAGE